MYDTSISYILCMNLILCLLCIHTFIKFMQNKTLHSFAGFFFNKVCKTQNLIKIVTQFLTTCFKLKFSNVNARQYLYTEINMCFKKVFGNNNDNVGHKKFWLEYFQFLQNTSSVAFVYFCSKFQEQLVLRTC